MRTASHWPPGQDSAGAGVLSVSVEDVSAGKKAQAPDQRTDLSGMQSLGPRRGIVGNMFWKLDGGDSVDWVGPRPPLPRA